MRGLTRLQMYSAILAPAVLVCGALAVMGQLLARLSPILQQIIRVLTFAWLVYPLWLVFLYVQAVENWNQRRSLGTVLVPVFPILVLIILVAFDLFVKNNILSWGLSNETTSRVRSKRTNVNYGRQFLIL
jgi:hypothetical protein